MDSKVSHRRTFDIVLSLLMLCSGAKAASTEPARPGEATINKEAGRGGFLIVMVRLESGEELPFMVDTGSSGTVLDKSLVPKLGERLSSLAMWTMFGAQESGLYVAPKLYLGAVTLKTHTNVLIYDFRKASLFSRQRIMGILGMDCLQHYCVQIDFEAGKMRFLEPQQVNPVELGKAFALDALITPATKGVPSMMLPIIHHTGLCGGTNTNLVIDTGCNSDGAIDDGVIKGHYLTRFVHFLIPWRALRVGKCVWDDNSYTKLRTGTGWNGLGLRFLARHLVTFDFPKGTMYLKQRSVGPLRSERRRAA